MTNFAVSVVTERADKLFDLSFVETFAEMPDQVLDGGPVQEPGVLSVEHAQGFEDLGLNFKGIIDWVQFTGKAFHKNRSIN